MIRSYGVEALQDMIRRHVAWAEELAALVEADSEFELITRPPDPAMRPEPSCLFPSDEEIARLLFGSDKGRAKIFGQSLAAEERRGLPRKHPAYGARYWPAVKAYYDYEWGLIAEPPFSSAADETIPKADEVFGPITSSGRRTARKRA